MTERHARDLRRGVHSLEERRRRSWSWSLPITTRLAVAYASRSYLLEKTSSHRRRVCSRNKMMKTMVNATPARENGMSIASFGTV